MSHPQLTRRADLSVFLERIDLGVGGGAAVLPVVTEVEGELEFVTGLDLACHFESCVVEPHEVRGVVVAGIADQTPVGEFELVEV